MLIIFAKLNSFRGSYSMINVLYLENFKSYIFVVIFQLIHVVKTVVASACPRLELLLLQVCIREYVWRVYLYVLYHLSFENFIMMMEMLSSMIISILCSFLLKLTMVNREFVKQETESRNQTIRSYNTENKGIQMNSKIESSIQTNQNLPRESKDTTT